MSIARFEVVTCTSVWDEEGVLHRLFLEPYLPGFDGDPDDPNPVDDLLYDVKRERESPMEFQILTTTNEGARTGIVVEYPEPVKPGTVIDLEMRITQGVG